jgi:predicted neuraminidase
LGFEVRLQEHLFEDEVPFDSCHASTLIVLPDGHILAAWFGGTREGADDVAIWLSRRDEDGWKEPVKIADEASEPHWNPVLFRDGEGKVWLFYKVGKEIRSWRTMYRVSEDNGRTWSETAILVEGDSGGRGPVKNKPIILQDGTWVAPASIELDTWEAFADLSYDNGKTWTTGNKITLPQAQAAAGSDAVPTVTAAEADTPVPPVPAASFQGIGVIQPAVWESEPGQVHMLLRSTIGLTCRSDSKDNGKTWTDAYATDLPNNNSGLDLVRLDSGVLAVVYNPVAQNWGKRTPIVISLSRDNGSTWGETFVLEDAPGEYSYPAIVAAGDEVYVTYTWKRKRIAFWRLAVTS